MGGNSIVRQLRVRIGVRVSATFLMAFLSISTPRRGLGEELELESDSEESPPSPLNARAREADGDSRGERGEEGSA